MCVCVIVCNQQVSVEWGRNARASHCSALPGLIFQQRPWRGQCWFRGAEKDKIAIVFTVVNSIFSMSTVINLQEAGVVTVAPAFYTNLL